MAFIDLPLPRIGTDFSEPSLCTEHDPEIFFPTSDSPHVAEEAIAICRQCPNIRECFEFALEAQVDGIWGGTTPAERQAIARKHRRPRGGIIPALKPGRRTFMRDSYRVNAS